MGWILGFCAMASLGLPGLAGFWGEFPAILVGLQPGAGLNVGLFRVYMVDRRHRHRVRRRLPALAATSAPRSARPTEEFADDPHIHDVHVPEWIAWVPMLVAASSSSASSRTSSSTSPTRRCIAHVAVERRSGSGELTVLAALLAADVGVRPRRPSTATRSRPRSSSSALIVVLLLVDLFSSSERKCAACSSLAGIGLLGAR